MSIIPGGAGCSDLPRIRRVRKTISRDFEQFIRKWATKNNLTLNRAKTKEILFRANVRPDDNTQIPPACQDTERVTSLIALGVIITD